MQWQGPAIGVRQCSNVVIADNVVVHYPEHDGGYSSIQVDAVTEVSRSSALAYTAGLLAQSQGCTAATQMDRLHDCQPCVGVSQVWVQGTEISNNTFVNLSQDAWQLPISVGVRVTAQSPVESTCSQPLAGHLRTLLPDRCCARICCLVWHCMRQRGVYSRPCRSRPACQPCASLLACAEQQARPLPGEHQQQHAKGRVCRPQDAPLRAAPDRQPHPGPQRAAARHALAVLLLGLCSTVQHQRRLVPGGGAPVPQQQGLDQQARGQSHL